MTLVGGSWEAQKKRDRERKRERERESERERERVRRVVRHRDGDRKIDTKWRKRVRDV